MYGNCLRFLCVTRQRLSFRSFSRFHIDYIYPCHNLKVSSSFLPLVSGPTWPGPHYRQSKNWSHDRKSLPYKRPREYERLGRAVVSHSLSRTRLETVKATFVNFGFVIHSPSMGIESEDLGQSETFVLWEWVG